ncbi:hypothetical protein [Candidatus Nitrospira bockiana]
MVFPISGIRAWALVVAMAGLALVLDLAAAVTFGDSSATTESSCNFGMEKGELRQSCRVPIPPGCVVANFPGSQKPWTNISKGGATTCSFNPKETDWKTRITGSCTRCATEHCSARFAVVFDCSASMPPPTNQHPPRTP